MLRSFAARYVLPIAVGAAALAFSFTAARAEDAPPPETAPEKKKGPEFDDKSIFLDWKICKGRGVAHCKSRGDYWAGQTVAGKDTMWLGMIWMRAQVYPKAIEAFEKFIAYEPTKEEADNYKKNQTTASHALIECYTGMRDWANTCANRGTTKFNIRKIEPMPTSASNAGYTLDEMM